MFSQNMSKLDFITICQDEEPIIKWPVSGKKYTIEIMVSHDGPNYDDIWYSVVNGADEIFDLLSYGGLSFEELTESEYLPLASGYYEVVVEFFHDKCVDWETGYDEGDDGLIVISCKRLRNLELDLIGV